MRFNKDAPAEIFNADSLEKLQLLILLKQICILWFSTE